jgi:hypothetical protein
MSKEEFATWTAMNPTGLTFRETASRPCFDCPAAYAREQRRAGTCNGFYGGELP